MPIILPRSTDNRALFVCALLAHRRSQGVARDCLQDASQRITLIGCGRYEDPRAQHRNGVD
jgi:hypothetical protein